MLKEQSSLWRSVVVAGLTVFAATEVTAAGTPSPAVAQPPPRACTINVLGGSVKIHAGPNGIGGLDPNFPLLQSGGVCAGLGTCLEWRYLFTYLGLTPQKAALAVDTDITVQDCEPNCQVTKLIPLVSEGERSLIFSATTTPFTASYFTPVGVGPGTMTASFVAKKGSSPRVGLCALSGADNVVTSTNLPVATQVIDRVGDCTIERTIDEKGCTVAIDLVDDGGGTCLIEPDAQAKIDGIDSIAIGCKTKVTVQVNPIRYCYPKPTGGMTCATSSP